MELVNVDFTGDVLFVKDVIDVEEEILLQLNEEKSVQDYTFIDKYEDGTSGGFDRNIIIFEHQGHTYKTMVIRLFTMMNEPIMTFTPPFRVFKEVKTWVSTTYTQRLTKKDNSDTIQLIEEEINRD